MAPGHSAGVRKKSFDSRRSVMPQSVYKVIEINGTCTKD